MFSDVYKNKKVLVTGHTGFKGAWLCQWLLNQGADVYGYSIDIPSQPSLFEALNLGKSIHHFIGDVADLEALRSRLKRVKPDYVFHLAAQAYVRRSYDEPVRTFETNLMGTVNVMEALRSTPSVAMGVIVTTDKCYLNLENGNDFVETDKLGGHDPYSASKAAAEIAFSAYWKSFFSDGGGARLATARAGNVIGGGDWSEDRLIPDCVKKWSQGQEVVLRSPSSVRPWQHVLDSLCGYLTLGRRLVENKNLGGESFNFGPEDKSKKTVLEMVDELQKNWPRAKYRVDLSTVGNKKESGLLFLSFEKARRELGWAPRWDFSQSVSHTARWYAHYYESPSSALELVNREISEYERSSH